MKDWTETASWQEAGPLVVAPAAGDAGRSPGGLAGVDLRPFVDEEAEHAEINRAQHVRTIKCRHCERVESTDQ